MKYLLYIPLIFSLYFVNAQTWSKSYDLAPEDILSNSDYGSQIVPFKDGFVVLSVSTCNNRQNGCFGLIFIDSVGNLIKKVINDDPVNPIISGGTYPVHIDQDNSIFVVAQQVLSEDEVFRIVLIKFDDEGEILWENHYQGPFKFYPRSVIRKADGGFLIHCDGNSDTENRTDIVIIETDSEGNQIDEIQLNLRDSLDISQFGNSIMMDDSSIFVNCVSVNFDREPWYNTSYLVKLNKEREVVWLKQLYKVQRICASSIRKTLDNHIVFSACVDTSIAPFFNPIVLHFTKFDINGNVVHETLLDSDIIRKNFGMTVTNENNVLVFGEIESLEFPPVKGWIAKFNSSNDLLWERKYYLEGPLRDYFFILDVIELPDNSLLATGQLTDVSSDGFINGNTWVLKLDSEGCFDPDNCEDEILITSYSNVTIPNSSDISVYPSLANSLVTLKIPESINGLDLDVIDLQGKPIYQKKNVINGETITIDQAGTFIFRFTHKNSMVATRKIVSVSR